MDTVFSMLENAAHQNPYGRKLDRIGNSNPSSHLITCTAIKEIYIVIATANDALFKKLICVRHGKQNWSWSRMKRFATNPWQSQKEKWEHWMPSLKNGPCSIPIRKSSRCWMRWESLWLLWKPLRNWWMIPDCKVRNMLFLWSILSKESVRYPQPWNCRKHRPSWQKERLCHGEHTDRILRDVLHYGQEDIYKLWQNQII